MSGRWFAALVGASLLSCGAAHAEGGRLTHLQASKLLAMCQSPKGAQLCDAYVSGISDGITLVETQAGPDVARKVCIPQATGSQLRGTVTKWLSTHPDKLSADVGPVVYEALGEAFPCGAGGKK